MKNLITMRVKFSWGASGKKMKIAEVTAKSCVSFAWDMTTVLP